MKYIDEILSNENHKSILPIAQAVISLLSIVMGVILLAIILSTRENSSDSSQSTNNCNINSNQGDFNDNSQLISNGNSKTNGNSTLKYDLPAAVISVNIIYNGCYYFPYMALAFFNSPIITTIIYLTLVVLYMCVYLICLGAWRLLELIKKAKEKCDNTAEVQNNKAKRRNVKNVSNCLILFCILYDVGNSFFFLFIIIFVITSGGFDDFEELNTLAPSLLIAGVSLILLKPAYNTVTNKMKSKDGETENPVQQQTLEQQDQRRT